MNDEFERMWKDVVFPYFGAESRIWFGRAKEKDEVLSLHIR
jgi:hypothetical protein